MTPITLETLPQATAQEVFDQVANHLLNQKEKCLSDDGYSCAYRNQQNLKCAAGCLIGEEEYSPDLEGLSWESLVEAHELPKTHKDLIATLQSVHDSCTVEKWYETLKRVAEDYDLEWKK